MLSFLKYFGTFFLGAFLALSLCYYQGQLSPYEDKKNFELQTDGLHSCEQTCVKMKGCIPGEKCFKEKYLCEVECDLMEGEIL